MSTFSSGRKCPHVCKGICWWWINGSLTHHGKDVVTTNPFLSLFSSVGPCTHSYELIWSSIHNHCFHVNGHQIKQPHEQKPGTNVQKEGHTLTPPSNWNGPEDPEVFRSAPSQSPSQSPARKPDCPETWYCLEIQVISTKDDKAIPPPSHIRQVPVMEDMV